MAYEEDRQDLGGMMDELTGIYNRQGFYKFTRELLDRNPDQQFCLIYWNIQKFKVINELFGRATGDKILRLLADTLKRDLDDKLATYARLERDNFMCCVTEEIIQRGNWKRLQDIGFLSEDSEYHFHSCCGLYRITDRQLTVGNMVDKARVAMETVKDNYVHPYAWYEESMWEAILEEQRLSDDFREAIAQRQFKVYYQPICRALDGVVAGAEALVRWEHPQRGLIPPGVFIPIFERNGFISILDRYVWNEVCSMQRSRIQQGRKTVPISINVSRVEFYNPNLCEDIHRIVLSHQVPTSLIHIEVTESAYSDNPDQVRDAVHKLQQNGFIVLMDDFGSGFSSLNILKDLPIDVLKIDMKFIDSLEHSRKAAIIIEAVIRMAKWMNLKVVAEGVETRKEWEYLRSVECDLVQGYHFCRPVPRETAEALMDEMEIGLLANRKNEFMNLEDHIPDIFNLGKSRESILFYSMLGGMGIMEMTDDSLEIIQVNQAYYEVIYGSREDLIERAKSRSKSVREPERSILMEGCCRARETDRMQQVQIHFSRVDGSYVWLNVKIRYLDSRGKRALFYFALDNIDGLKKVEREQDLHNYSEALIRVFDQVYCLDYATGEAQMLHTCYGNAGKIQEKYHFVGFLQRFADHIEWVSNPQAADIVEHKESLDRELNRSQYGNFSFSYRLKENRTGIREVSALLFKVEMQDGKEEYLCCMKHT